MRPFSSLTNRIFLACTLLAALSLGFAFYFVNARVSRESEAELRRGLLEAGTLVDQHRTTLTDTFTRMAHLVADLPVLKAAVATGDPPTVQPVAEEYNKTARADMLVVSDRNGQVLASIGFDAVAFRTSMPQHDAASEFATFWATPRGVLQVVSVPIVIKPSELLGSLTVGFFLDDRMAQQFKDLTGSEIAFGARGQILASTLVAPERTRLAHLMNADGMSTVTLGDEEFLVLRRTLGSAAVAPVALILRSRTERLQFLAAIRTGLAGALIVMVLLATILSYLVARSMTAPLAAVTDVMRHVATTGDLTRKVTLDRRSWDDEDARLLATTFNTLTDSIARFQKEAAQKERLSSLGRLSTVVAHEIRNPLMIIRTSLRSLRREDVSEEVREAVADIDEETTRLNRIVSEVLDFARPIRFEFAETNVNAVCAASAHAATAGDPDPPIALALDPSDPRIVTDAERLRTVLVNVLTNARHAVQAASRTPEGGVAVLDEAPVTLETARTAADRVTITVRDRGIGIASADLAHIFDPYFTTRRAGTGLGLPIAKNIIDGMGGVISVTSRQGAGTEIRIELPETPPGLHT